MFNKTETERTNFRYNLLTTVIYIVGIVLLVQLFNLQIIHGKEYRETSNTKLSKEAIVKAARGKILDRTGTILAETQMGFNIQIFKTKASEQEMNESMLILAETLEKNGDKYIDDFPISVEPFQYNFPSEEALNKWRDKFEIAYEASPEEAFYVMKDKYNVTEQDVVKARKIVGLRYTLDEEGYSSTSALEIAANVSRASAMEIDERGNELPGISIEVKSNRVYTQGTLASHILGYISRIDAEEYKSNSERYQRDDYIGKTGIEKMFEPYLKGENGKKQIDMTVDGTSTGEYITQEAIGGANVVLTIDSNLQNITERALANSMDKIRTGGWKNVPRNITGGSAVVINVKNGEVLAMTSLPDYEPGQFLNGISQSKYDEYQTNRALWNRAIQGSYAPGSIFKMVTAIAGLQEGVINATERINDTGIFPASKSSNTPHCWIYDSYRVGHGNLNVSGAIAKSCNYFFYETGYRLGLDRLSSYASYFGLGRKTGIELPSEEAGTLSSPKIKDDKPDVTLTSSAIGQSYNDFTPIQVAKYVAMIANRGKVVNPTIIKNVVTSDGKQIPKAEIEQYLQQNYGLVSDDTDNLNISDENMNAVLEGMRDVTDDHENGTASQVFKGFGIPVGGKTGSAEAGKDGNGNDLVNAWFVGFAPFDNPEIAVIAMVENGLHGYYVAEAVKEIISEYFGMNIPVVNENVNAVIETEALR